MLSSAPEQPFRILIVDDNRAIHDDFRKILLPAENQEALARLSAVEAALFDEPVSAPPADPAASPAYELESAYQGAEAVQKIRAAVAAGRPFALAFIDVRMPPGMDGVKTTAQLWTEDPDLQVVLCTAYSDYSWAEMTAELGRSDRLVILKKPFDSVEALQLASALTEKWRLLKSNRAHIVDLERRVEARTADLAAANVRLLAEIETRRQTERQLAEARDLSDRANRAKTVFLANMSHEIRTPLNGVIGMANLLLDTPLSAEQRDLVDTLCDSGDALLAIINDILDFSKVEAGCMDLESCDFDLPRLVERAIDLQSSFAARKQIELIWDVEPGAPARVYGDPTRLRQVLLNLVNNALKFTDAGEICVRVRQLKRTGDISFLRFEVCDTGIGIDADALSRIFQPFTQADDSTTRRYGGTGLGLAICKRIVTLMGGEIGAESRVGSGSLFWFEVSLRVSDQPGPVLPPVSADLGRFRALVVDDNATNRKLLLRLLADWGLPAEAASDGPSALDAIRHANDDGRPFDVVLLDYQMPDMDGLAVASAIQEIRSTRPPPALVMLTSHGERIHGQALARHGLAACQLKPIHPLALHECLSRVLGEFAPDATSSDLPPARPLGLPPLRVLVAEDNAVNRKVVQLQLRSLGLEADFANDGEEALDALRRQPYDVVLMDACMPRLDGLEATRRIRALQAAADPAMPASLVVIAMTANAMPGDRGECLAAGMDDYIAKPVTVPMLHAALIRHFSKETSSTT